MAEYDRREKKPESRAVTYHGGGSKQLKGIVDNRLINNNSMIQRKLEPSIIKHIFEGDETTDRMHITGYHSKARKEEAFATACGDTEDLGNGFYKQKVKERKPKGKGGAREKLEKSTFFPDNFSEDAIIKAIDITHGSTNPYEVECAGENFKVLKSGKTIFPFIE